MNKAIKVTAALCCLFFCAAVFAHPAKVKPASKTAAQVKKIDYAKLKTEIRSLYRAEKHKEAMVDAALESPSLLFIAKADRLKVEIELHKARKAP